MKIFLTNIKFIAVERLVSQSAISFFIVVLLVTSPGILSPTYGQWEKYDIDTNINWPVALNAADVDGDDDMDLAATGEQDDDVLWYENMGGTPISWAEHIIDGNLDGAVGVYFADIDGDGDLDLAATGLSADDVVWYENLGGTPISWTKHTIDGNLDGAAVVCVADIDGDDTLDVVATGQYANDVVWYENMGGTPISWTKYFIDSDLAEAVGLEVADIDGDGDLDVVATGHTADDVVWYENLGGTPIGWDKHTIDGNLDGAFDVNVADIDGDDTLDVVVTGYIADDVVWYENLGGTPISWAKHPIDENLNGARDLHIADIDGDDTLDVTVTGFDADIVVWYKNQHPTWTRDTIDPNLNGANDIITADIDGDNNQDVIVTGLLANKVVWYRNPGPTGDEAGSFYFEGKLRRYNVYLPQNFQANMPVILNLHGYGTNWTIENHAKYTFMHDIADTSGFIVVYPAGSVAPNGRPSWNNGLRDHPFGQTDTTSNDVGFLLALIDTLYAHYDIDLNQVYCCGFSMGGEMTYRMAIEAGNRFAAFASVSGKINDGSAGAGTPAGPYPILHFHGTNDDVETYDGENDGNLWPVEETISYWVDNNNCVYEADTVSISDTDLTDGSTVQKISYLDCSDNSRVIFFKILGGGHGWPGSTESMYPNGNPNRDINASAEIVNFFKNNYLATSLQTKRRNINNEFALKQNYPNPFNPVTMINYQLPMTSTVELSIYNLLGQKVATLVNERKRAGYHQVKWDASGFSSGVYLLRLSAGDFVETKKMVLMR